MISVNVSQNIRFFNGNQVPISVIIFPLVRLLRSIVSGVKSEFVNYSPHASSNVFTVRVLSPLRYTIEMEAFEKKKKEKKTNRVLFERNRPCRRRLGRRIEWRQMPR